MIALDSVDWYFASKIVLFMRKTFKIRGNLQEKLKSMIVCVNVLIEK